MGEIDSLNAIFVIACDSYGLNTNQIDSLIESSNIIAKAIKCYDPQMKETYIKNYQDLCQILTSGQKGGVFDLTTASRVFKALMSLKNYVVGGSRDKEDLLEVDNHFLQLIIKEKVYIFLK